jgi:ABC-type multidrug transport system fused ATPase/permease subunit
MISFLKTILVILLVYLGLKYLLRLLSPYIMRFIAKKAAQRFENTFGQSPFQQTQKQNQDKVATDGSSKKSHNDEKIVGEYIDFEEVE